MWLCVLDMHLAKAYDNTADIIGMLMVSSMYYSSRLKHR